MCVIGDWVANPDDPDDPDDWQVWADADRGCVWITNGKTFKRFLTQRLERRPINYGSTIRSVSRDDVDRP